MRKLFAWLGVAMLTVFLSPDARADEPLKPYVVLMLDTSGSMDSATGSGPPSCGGEDNRLNHARCAINKIVNSYGDMVFALGRFRATPGGTFVNSCDANGNGDGSGGDQCTSVGIACGSCNCNGLTTDCSTNASCTPALRSDARGEMLTGLIDGDNSGAARFTDFSCGTCTNNLANDPEIWGSSGFTPLAGYMSTAHRYWQGLQATDGTTIFPDTVGVSNDGFDPIRNDPKKLEFLPDGCDPRPPPACGANCCANQCRPYITIMLTDGDETCGGNAVPVITSMRQTDLLDGGVTRRYLVETKVIGFGVSPGDPDIEAYAIAGAGLTGNGAPGDDGFYVQNENELQVAISKILDDAIRTEKCNDLDDDCDGTPDEDFVGKGNACNNGGKGVCRRDGFLACKADETGLECDAVSAVCVNDRLIENGIDIGPCIEICNNLDDDCDGKVDEGLAGCACTPQTEICDGKDNDCDGRIDEASPNGPPLTRPCGTGTCQGIETCNFAVNCPGNPPPGTCDGFGGCTAQQPTAEVCDGLDNNCDGLRDGFQQACSTMNPLPPENFPIDDPRNSPGDPSNTPNPANICHPGIKLCPANVGPPNSFTTCGNEVKPCNVPTNNNPPAPNPAHPNPTCLDQCNGLDDDCDNVVDEDFQPQDCSDNCNTGVTTCVNGVLGCTLVPITTDDTCDGIDDDCDGNFDEDYDCDPNTPGKQTNCPCSDALTCNGVQKCVAGVEICEGTPISSESCDCSDNNCNGIVDEGNICASGSTCSQFCQCAQPCSNSEFPCPLGKICQAENLGCQDPAQFPGCDPSDACTQNPANTNCCCRRLCITDPCFNVTCPPGPNGEAFVCQLSQPDLTKAPIGTCVDACSVANCAPLICIPETGQCATDDCRTFPERCSANQNCINGVCVTNPCDGQTCPTDTYCVGGNCVGSCAGVDCPDGQRCRLGVCETDPCGKPCPFGMVCNDESGECVPDLGCGAPCPVGQYCNHNNNGGECEDDPCQISEVVCPTGEICVGGTCFDPAQFGPDGGSQVRVTAGGGGCNTGTAGSGALIGLALLMFWRRRKGGRA